MSRNQATLSTNILTRRDSAVTCGVGGKIRFSLALSRSFAHYHYWRIYAFFFIHTSTVYDTSVGIFLKISPFIYCCIIIVHISGLFTTVCIYRLAYFDTEPRDFGLVRYDTWCPILLMIDNSCVHPDPRSRVTRQCIEASVFAANLVLSLEDDLHPLDPFTGTSGGKMTH